MRPLRVRTPLGLFSVLWAVAAALHHLEAQPLAGLPLYPFVILLLLFPERIWALAAFSLAHATLLSFDLPAAANHSVLALLVNGCILSPEKWPLPVRLAGGARWVRRNARWLGEVPGARVPFMEVRRALQLWRDIGFTRVSIGYERNGEWFETEDAFSDPELMRPLRFWERKLMAFRAVQNDGEESRCRW